MEPSSSNLNRCDKVTYSSGHIIDGVYFMLTTRREMVVSYHEIVDAYFLLCYLLYSSQHM